MSARSKFGLKSTKAPPAALGPKKDAPTPKKVEPVPKKTEPPAKKEEPKKEETKKEEAKKEESKKQEPQAEPRREAVRDEPKKAPSNILSFFPKNVILEMKEKKAKRASTNVLGMFPQTQIQEFKEKANRKKKVEDKPSEESAEPRRAQRTTSNVFAFFKQTQIQELKEAFTMIDANRDGFIDLEDLREIHMNLGRQPTDDELKKMLSECPGQLNFTSFLTLFGEKMHGTDPESTLRQAFEQFDPEKKGKLPEEYIKDLLKNMGDNFKDDEIRQVWKEAPISGGLFDYQSFVTLVKRGNQEDMAA